MIRLEYLDQDELVFDGNVVDALDPRKKRMLKSKRAPNLRIECLPELENDINLLIMDTTTKAPLDHTKWFGESVTSNRDFKTKIAKLYEACVKATLTIKIFGPTRTDGSGMVAGPVEDINSPIVLQRFFGHKNRLWGEDVLTVIHEITHKESVLGTKDVKDGGEDAYQWRALKLAQKEGGTDLCLTNADSWAYFLVQGAVYPRVKGLSQSGPANWKTCHFKNVKALCNGSRRAPSTLPVDGTKTLPILDYRQGIYRNVATS
jgi:hypothetical protein